MPSEVRYFKGTVKELRQNLKANIQQESNPAVDTLRLCKLFGAYRCLSEIKDMIPLIHGPIGCACNNRFFIGLATNMHGFPVDLLMTCTDLKENDIIFGGEDKLREAILEVDEKYHPKIIAVFNTCPPGIVGDDIDGVARDVQPEVSARILPIHSEGYGHFNHYAGYKDAYDALMKHIVKPPKQVRKNLINIVGDKNDYRAGKGMNDIRSLMKTLSKMDIHLHTVIPGGATVEELEEAANVSLNVMKCDSMAINFCEAMKETYGVDHTQETIPIGIEATIRWTMEIAEKLGIVEQAKSVIDEEMKELTPYVEKAKSVLQGKTVAVTGNYARAIAFLEFAMELGMKPVSLGLYGFNFAGEAMLDRLCDRLTDDFEIIVGVSMHEQKEMIKRLKPDLFLADFREKSSSTERGLAGGDVPIGRQPQLGFEGVKYLSQCMVNWLNNPLAIKYGSKFGNERSLCDQNFVKGCSLKPGKEVDDVHQLLDHPGPHPYIP
ncbi:MAG TPA: nitrogenase component 1 [Anaerolineales bacterium]|nr:nitrogenase component 1 [Anaerolineales bacterium]